MLQEIAPEEPRMPARIDAHLVIEVLRSILLSGLPG